MKDNVQKLDNHIKESEDNFSHKDFMQDLKELLEKREIGNSAPEININFKKNDLNIEIKSFNHEFLLYIMDINSDSYIGTVKFTPESVFGVVKDSENSRDMKLTKKQTNELLEVCGFDEIRQYVKSELKKEEKALGGVLDNIRKLREATPNSSKNKPN